MRVNHCVTALEKHTAEAQEGESSKEKMAWFPGGHREGVIMQMEKCPLNLRGDL